MLNPALGPFSQILATRIPEGLGIAPKYSRSAYLALTGGRLHDREPDGIARLSILIAPAAKPWTADDSRYGGQRTRPWLLPGGAGR